MLPTSHSAIIETLQDNRLMIDWKYVKLMKTKYPWERQSTGTMYLSLHCGVRLSEFDMSWDETATFIVNSGRLSSVKMKTWTASQQNSSGVKMFEGTTLWLTQFFSSYHKEGSHDFGEANSQGNLIRAAVKFHNNIDIWCQCVDNHITRGRLQYIMWYQYVPPLLLIDNMCIYILFA